MLFNREATTIPEIHQELPDSELLKALSSPFRKRVNEVSADLVHFDVPEFTCLCPMTRQPDFAVIQVWYIPKEYIVESKSLKLYMHSFRNVGAFHEMAVRVIREDLTDLLKPRWIMVTGEFNRRGGIASSVSSTHAEGTFNSSEQLTINQFSDIGKLRFRV